jgi:hypothetical protein
VRPGPVSTPRRRTARHPDAPAPAIPGASSTPLRARRRQDQPGVTGERGKPSTRAVARWARPASMSAMPAPPAPKPGSQGQAGRSRSARALSAGRARPPSARRRTRCGLAQRSGAPLRPRTHRTRLWCTAGGDRGTGPPLVSHSAAKHSTLARRTENKASEWARHQRVNSHPSSEDASRVSPRYRPGTRRGRAVRARRRRAGS